MTSLPPTPPSHLSGRPAAATGTPAATRRSTPTAATGRGTTTPTATPRRPDTATPRNEGQWALGHREPLNANEQFKQDDDGLNVRHRIETVYARDGFASIDPDDLHGRFRWWGLYTQRRPGIDGGKTALLAPHELEDEHFMLRVRLDGGQLSLSQLRALAAVSTAFARDTADLTDRQNVQLHWVRIEDVPAIWDRLEAVGLTTAEACGDTPRVVLGSPLAGVSAEEIVDATPAIERIHDRYVGDPALSNLPRKFKTAISGSPRQDVVHEINDVAFVGVVHPQHGPGFDVWVGGGLSTDPRLAQRLGAWVPLGEVPEVWAGVVGVFRDYGYRRLRNRARLKFLIDDWGVDQFRRVLETEYLHRPLVDGPPPGPVPAGFRDHVGVQPQVDGRFAVGVAPRVGRLSGTLLTRIADLAQAQGSGRVRTTPDQKLVLLDVPAGQVEALTAALDALDLPTRPSVFRRATMACTGIEYCKLAIVETKARAGALIDELERRLGDLDTPLSIHLNGCPNSCARIQIADIGLKGVLVTRNGAQVEGFQVHLGGGLAGPDRQAGFGRKPRGLKLAADEVADYVERVVRRYLAGRADGEAFAAWAVRADEGELL